MRPPTRKSTAPMCEPSSAPSRLNAIRRKSVAVIHSPARVYLWVPIQAFLWLEWGIYTILVKIVTSLLVALIFALPLSAQTKTIAITIDDLPYSGISPKLTDVYE